MKQKKREWIEWRIVAPGFLEANYPTAYPTKKDAQGALKVFKSFDSGARLFKVIKVKVGEI